MINPALPILFLLVVSSPLLAQKSAERQFALRVSVDTLRNHVQTLVKMGNRWGGTQSGNRSARWIAATMKRYGLTAEVQQDPQRLVYTHERWTLRVVDPPRLRRLIRNDWLAGFSPSLAPTTALLADLDVDNTDLTGKAVVTDRLVTEDLYEDLAEKGAIAILSFAPGDSTIYPDWAMITPLPASQSNAIPLYNISYRNGSVLRHELSRGTNIRIALTSRTVIKEGAPKTVVGRIRGTGAGRYIVCAHGDSDAGGPGADDNASGVAGVLEVARVLSTMVQTRAIRKPVHTIEFVVWGSEYYSSEHFVRRQGEELRTIRGVLNYDQIGTGATRNCIYFEANDVPHNKNLLSILNSIGEQYAGRKGFWQEATTNPSQGGTDSYVFLPEHLSRLDAPLVLIPSVTIYTAAWNTLRRIPQTEGWSSKAWKGPQDTVLIDFSRYYHSSRDVPELTTEREPFNMVWAVKAVGISLLRLAWE
jgi:hypothetical protein